MKGDKKDWSNHARFLSASESDDLYRRMTQLHWSIPKSRDEAAFIAFGLSYSQGPGGVREEIPAIPDFLKRAADKIALHVSLSANYIQCHRMTVDGLVRPHHDPSGMIVPMLTLGQERTFRVGGTFPYNVPKARRPVECHKPEAEILMRQGDLLVFNGGRTAHSMFDAARDSQSVIGGYHFRISILFRYTTAVMRAMGPDRRKWSPGQVQQHEAEYRLARENFLEARQAQGVLF